MSGTVIPRFSFPQLDQSSDPLEIGMEPSSRGEYVLWKDVRHLLSEGVSDVRLTLEFVSTSEELPDAEIDILFHYGRTQDDLHIGTFDGEKFLDSMLGLEFDPHQVLAWAYVPTLGFEELKKLNIAEVKKCLSEPLPQFDPEPTKPAA